MAIFIDERRLFTIFLFMKSILQKLLFYFFPPVKTLEEKWEEAWGEKPRVVETTITFSDGRKCTLRGKHAEYFHRDVWMASCGRRVDWSRHKWEQTTISS